jgi:hypothetical protein
MPVGTVFSLVVTGFPSEVSTATASASGLLDGAGGVLVHKAAAANMPLAPINHYTWIDSPRTNGNACAVIVVTPNYNPGGSGGTYNNHPIGVWYDVLTGKWAIFNQDGGAIPPGASFNVLVPRPTPVC